jgi:hypothetical protein
MSLAINRKERRKKNHRYDLVPTKKKTEILTCVISITRNGNFSEHSEYLVFTNWMISVLYLLLTGNPPTLPLCSHQK